MYFKLSVLQVLWQTLERWGCQSPQENCFFILWAFQHKHTLKKEISATDMWKYKQRNFQCMVYADNLTSSCLTPLPHIKPWLGSSHGMLHQGQLSHQSFPSLYFWHFSLSVFPFLLSDLSTFHLNSCLCSPETSISLEVYLIPDGIWNKDMWWNWK